LTEASERFKALGNNYEAGYALNYRGVSHHVAGEQVPARRDYLTALSLFRAARDEPAQALSLQSLALQSNEDGRLSDAMREFDDALALIPRDEDPENYAHTLHNSAWPLRALGRFDAAAARFHEAGEILRSRGDRDGEARALHGIATTLMYAGEPERAAEYLDAAVRLRGETGSRREQALSLNVLGQLEQDSGHFDRAIADHQQALRLASAPHDVAQIRLALAKAQIAIGRRTEAFRQLEEILRLGVPPTHRYRGLALSELGNLEALENRPKESIEYFSRAVEVARKNGSDLDHALILVNRAEVQLRYGNTQGAIADARVAIDRLDSIGLESLQAESRAAFRASYREAVETQIAALLEESRLAQSRASETQAQNILAAALALSDHARAQLLAESEFVPAGAASGEQLDRRRSAYELIAGKRQQRDRLMNSASPDENRIVELTLEINRLRTEVSSIEREIAGSGTKPHPTAQADEYGRLSGSIPKDVVLAEFFIGQTRAWLFEVREGAIAVHDLGSARAIQSFARRLHLEWRSYRKTSADRLKDSRQLSALLFGKVTPLGAGDSLVVIPDGPLHVVPIVTLARQVVQMNPKEPVRIALTLSSLVTGRADDRRRAEALLAVIADPIYTADDPRIRGAKPAASAYTGAAILTRYAQDLARMRRLPATAVEASSIVALVDGNNVLSLTGADANRRKVSSARLDTYRIVHFATHAFADGQDPALATLALSQFDENGQANDGYLRSFDIAEMRLKADLVVLSACNTAIGREIAGEAPLGLAYAFLRSGARSVLATLWQVPDTSSARLMEEFYRQMLVEQRPPPVALDLAQQHIRGQARWSDPYFWAGFQLTSNARIDVGNKNVNGREG
jgi:CHAT domain-containing protein/tetratricopeptide (TPR) repeat protein